MEKQMKLFTNMTKPLVLFVLLFALGVGEMWAGGNCGFYGDNTYIRLWVNGTTSVYLNCNGDGVSDLELGDVDELYLAEIRSIVWKNKEGYGNVCKVIMHYGINTSRDGSEGSTYDVGYNNSGYADWWGSSGDDANKHGQQFKAEPNSLNLLSGLTPGTEYYLDFMFSLEGSDSNSSDCEPDKDKRNNNGGNYHVHFRVADNKSHFTSGKYLYFDARDLTNWQAKDFDTKFYFKKHYNPFIDVDDELCTKTNALEDWVYYVQVPEGDHIGRVQLNRVRPEGDTDENYLWNWSNPIQASSRDNISQNCLYGEGEVWSDWNPTWTTYCPPMSDVDLEEDGTTLSWGGDGSSGTPYLIPTGASIKVKATNATKAVDDDNMTIYYQFKKAGTEVQTGSTTASATITASGSTGTKEAVTVEAYNYYNSTSGTHLASNEIYYEVRTPYTISYNAGTGGSGSRASETKLKGVNFATPNSAIFRRTGYTQTGWATSDLSAQVCALGGNYTSDEAATLYPVWTPNTYTVRFENQSADTGYKGSLDTTVTFNDTINMKGGIEKPRKRHYVFGGYYISTDKGVSLTNTQIIDADGKWNKDVSGYTGTKDGVASWVCAADTVLYAKWTDSIYTVAVQVSPAGAGEVRVSGSAVSEVTAGFTVRSSEMTPVGASVLWKFKEWRVSSDDCVLDLAGTDYHRDFQPGTDNKMKITARATGQTLTAVFEPRYYFVGGEIMSGDDAIGTGTSSGMPGWDNYNVPFNVITNTPIHATCSLTLTSSNPTANYLIEVRDRVDGLSYGKSAHLGDGDTITFDTRDVKVTFQANAGKAYTFAITGVDANDRPKVSVERPHQVNFGRKYINIGGSLTDGDDGGTVAVTKDADASNVSNGAWLPYGTAVTYTASPISGYKVDWYSSDDYDTGYITSSYTFKHAGKSTGNGYVKFTELATKVTLSNDGHGHIEIGGETAENTTCGVTTTRSLTAVPNTGYSFSSWTKVTGDDITISPTDATPTTLTGGGYGLTSGQNVQANFTAKTYTVTLNNDHGGEDSDNGSATATFDATTIDVSSHASFEGWTLLGYWNTDGNQVTDASGNLKKNVTNYTDEDGKWKYDNNVTLYAHWSRSVTLDDNGGSADGLVTVTYKGTAGTPSAPTKTGYHVEAYYAEEGLTNKVMEANGTLVNYSGYVTDGKWVRGEATTLYAKWAPDTYTVTLHNDHEGDSSEDGTATATYDATTLSSITDAQFSGWTLLGYWNSSAVQVADAEGNLKKSVSTFTDSDGKWIKTDNAEVWAHWSRTITLDDNVSQLHNGSVSVTYKGAAASHTAPHSREGYTLDGYYAEAACTTKVMNSDGTLVASVSGYTDATPNWIHKTAATLYTKWVSDHFIIYRTDDKSDDPRKLSTDVESYVGGTLDQAIEFRMKVRELDKWYTLCLPFTVSAVKVWDEEDCEYYDLVPYYRPEVGDTLQGGHYIIRTPKTATNLAITEFGDWRDPTSPTGYKPSANTPYIIQWHMSYFDGKYVSFFGAAGQDIPSSMSAGTAPTASNVVNVCVNNSMTTGSATGAYMLDKDYGDGAWLRDEDAGKSRFILPFECYVLANTETTERYLVIRRDMTITETPTGFDKIMPDKKQTNKVIINGQLFIIRDNKMYNIYGKEVQQ